jgi:nitric oxide reductase subunit B
MSFRTLWIAFGLVVLLSFAVLGWTGVRIYQEAPPVPERVVTTDGAELIRSGDIQDGQNVWQAMGGMEVGSIWGHGSYVAPDWTADWLHREATFILDGWSGTPGGYAQLPPERQAALRSRLEQLLRTNTYDAGTITVDRVRADAFAANLAHYTDVFTRGREEYAIPAGTLTGDDNLRKLAAFFFWTSWAASTNRPGDTITYTSNWPHEPLVGNRPTGDTVVWTGVSIILLLAGIGVMASYYASVREHPLPGEAPANDPLLASVPTPSQRAVVKYFWIVASLLIVQILLGVVTAHYGVEGDAFYGSRCRTGCPTRSAAHGTCSSGSSGLRRRGWRRACTSARR